jgi:ABC-type polysaccharide/polyol phosphate export permease
MPTRETLGARPPTEPPWKVNIRVVNALLVREMLTRYGRNNIGFLWLFLEPMLFTVVVTALWTATRGIHQSDLPIAAFTLTGYSSILLWRNMAGRCIAAMQANRALLYHRQVRMIDVYTARILLEFGGVTGSFVILGIALWAIEWIPAPEDVLQVATAWMLLAWFSAGLALTLGSLSERFLIIQKMWSPMVIIMFALSGAAFMVDTLPPNAREILLYIPMLNAVEYLREGFFGSLIRAHYDLGYLIAVNLILMLFGLTQVRRVVPGEGNEF